jgi:hypothetical protein
VSLGAAFAGRVVEARGAKRKGATPWTRRFQQLAVTLGLSVMQTLALMSNPAMPRSQARATASPLLDRGAGRDRRRALGGCEGERVARQQRRHVDSAARVHVDEYARALLSPGLVRSVVGRLSVIAGARSTWWP